MMLESNWLHVGCHQCCFQVKEWFEFEFVSFVPLPMTVGGSGDCIKFRHRNRIRRIVDHRSNGISTKEGKKFLSADSFTFIFWHFCILFIDSLPAALLLLCLAEVLAKASLGSIDALDALLGELTIGAAGIGVRR